MDVRILYGAHRHEQNTYTTHTTHNLSLSHGKSGCVRTDTYACLPYTIRTISSLESLSISSNVFQYTHCTHAQLVEWIVVVLCANSKGGEKRKIEFYFSKIVHPSFMEIKIISNENHAVELLINSKKLIKIPKNLDVRPWFSDVCFVCRIQLTPCI